MQAFQANASLISKSFVQFSSQDPKYLTSLSTFIVVSVETCNSIGDAQDRAKSDNATAEQQRFSR
jgi:hypothetical protein